MRKLYGLIECCLNWRVVAGLVVLGAALFIYAPKLALALLPVLVVLICPISMLFMMRSMGKMNMGADKAEHAGSSGPLDHLSRDQQLQLLEAQLGRVQEQQRAIARELPALDRRRAAAGVAGAVGSNAKGESQLGRF